MPGSCVAGEEKEKLRLTGRKQGVESVGQMIVYKLHQAVLKKIKLFVK